ncbi:MAG: ADP-glyceromanno-heptose 6-epimerase [Bacteroidetes bacterium]|nr:ADP-glyceromanno-heptose 6-epimerase [Bacteroidota bacterium]
MSGKKIVLTGAAGFIGSYLLGYLNAKGYSDIVIVDDFEDNEKLPNYSSKQFSEKIERDKLEAWLKNNQEAGFVFHFGARTDTAEFDYAVHEKLNVQYSKMIWNYCAAQKIPLVYASSAATYGAGELGYKDDHELANRLQPLNPYGISKNEFDKWALQQIATPPFWAGLKFFNVYGPNEYHKGRMASMVLHGFNQIKETGKVKLFKAHRPDFEDGKQLRDFIYVKDVAHVCCWLMMAMENGLPGEASAKPGQWTAGLNGLYNLGTGKARTFDDLEKAVFAAMGKSVNIEYIDMPADIKDKYQYFTEADMTKLRNAGYSLHFTSLEEGIADYVADYLVPQKYY